MDDLGLVITGYGLTGVAVAAYVFALLVRAGRATRRVASRGRREG